MKKMILMGMFIAFVTVSVSSQIKLTDKEIQKQEDDSILNQFFKMQAERKLHKNNKDSAWINDMNGHTIWESRKKSKEGKVVVIHDPKTQNNYVLDATHTFITAYDPLKRMLWRINPRIDNHLSSYRHPNPVITYFQLDNAPDNKRGNTREKVIYISYSNTQFGYIELQSGKFIYQGQD